ncbi:MAG: hypothetical protein KDA24_01405 [Deltaproteobacteria bacterium]|nr:hypothetical protein [Deltaproteobacteria bacterium]
MHASTRLIPLFLILGLVLVMGCPTIKLGAIKAKPGSVTATSFTLVADVEVEELDETEGEDQQRQSGKGLLGVHVPAGWSVVAARVRSPKETVDRALFASPQGAAAYAESFPTTGGVWWGFASPTQEIAQGKWSYTLEVDVVVPKKTKMGDMGVAASILNDDLSDLTAPQQFGVAFKGKDLVLTPKRPPSGAGPAPAVTPADNAKAPAGG